MSYVSWEEVKRKRAAVRWPPKPPEGATCEASKGWKSRHGHPVVLLCGKPATETVRLTVTSIQAWLCNNCAEAIEASGSVLRNPKRKKTSRLPVDHGEYCHKHQEEMQDHECD